MFLHFARLFSYIACLTHVLVLGQDLAVVRPYASLSEVSSLESSFLSWDTFLPCNATLNVPVDLILVYSQAFDDNADAWNAASRVQESFQLGERPWHRCFRSVTISAANLTAAEDIYDSRGYAVRKDWVNGPNKVFRFILRSFVENEYAVNYTAFYFMEIDAVPVRSYWLEQYALEALCYPSAAIRGSRYLGDSWDMFGTVMPDDLLLHINGNAIYYIHHPWLRWLNSRLMDEATTEYNEVAFDVRMARLTLDARQGTTTELGEAWNQSVESGDEPYQHDSSLVGNFGNTLLNTSFEHGVYIKHGSLSNIFDNLENLTLVVATYNNTIEKFLETVSLYHPFRTIMVLHFDAHSGSNETIETPSGTTSIVHVEAAKPRHLALCELASMVTTPYFVFTDSSHLIASPAHVLATSSGHPVLPYINAGSTFCTARADCVSSLAQAEDLFGVKLNYHHDTFETVFITNVTQQFCVDWELASSELGSFEECAFVHGPTADDYIAWQISMDEALLYVPKEKERVGWRPWTISWTPHDPDERNCSVYTQAEQELHRQSISECGLIVESPETCKATSGCSWRPIFYSGKCIISPRISFPWQEEVQERPTTCEALQSTTTTTTASRSSTGTSTSTSASETTDTTTVTVTRSSTDTSTSQSATGTSTTTLTGTSTRIPGSCIQPSVADADTSSCTGKFAGDTCEVSCASGFLGQSTIYTCTVEETFSGTPPTCVPTTTVTTSSISTSQTTHTLTSTITATNTATSISHTSTATRSSTTATSSVTQTSHTLTSTITTSNTATSISHTSTATRSSTTASSSATQTTHILTSTISTTNTVTSISHTSTATRSSTTATSSVTQTSHTLTSTITTSNTATSISHTSTATRSSTTATSSLTQTSHTLTSTITTSNTATSISHTSTATSSITSTETTHTLTSTITTTSTVTSVSLTQTATSSSISATSSSTQTTHTVTRTMSTSKTVTSISHTVTSTTSQSTSQTTNTETSTISSSTSQTSHTQTSTSSATATVTGTSHTITSTTSQSTSQTTHTDTSTISTTETVTSISQTITSTTTRSTSQTTVTGTATRTSISATTATGTTSRVPGSCPVPIVDGADTQACDGKFPGETCEVSCSSGFLGQSSILTCSAQEVFTGTYPTCVPTTTMTTMTTTSTQLVACSDGLPTGVGTNVNDCYGKLNGQTCTVSCMVSYTGDSAEYYCNPSTASFEGPPVTCSKITCSADQLPSGYDVSGCTGLVARDFCFVSCERGFVSASEQYVCGVDGIFSGTPPTCQRATCPSDLLPAAPGVNVSACVGAFTGSSCDIACSFGFQGTSSSYTCSLDAVFEGTLPTCERKTCLVPADYMNSSFSHDCDGVQHGGSCTVSCAEGYGGSQIVQLCTDGILDGSLPTCTPIICSFRGLNIPLGIDVTPCVGILSGQSCTVSCMRGYSLVGTPTLECTTSGVFGKILASCEPQPCGNLTDVLPFAGTHIGESCNGVYTGQVCTAFCKEGYTISGNATVLICGDAPASSQGYTEFVPGTEESWAAEQSTGPTCNVNTCSEGIPDNPMLSHNCTNVQTGGFCIVDAVVPYQLEGGQTVQLICEASGYLTGNIPNIVPAVCPYASLGDGTGSTCHYTPYGADCWAYCLQGDGVARQYRCMLNGQALELQSVVQDIQCNSTGRRLSGSLNPCPSASVTQVGLEHLQFLHDCTDKLHDEACIAHCGFGFDMQEAEPSLFVCKDSTLVGSGLPTCVGKPCNFSFPSGLGVSHNCNAKTTGETCEASCGKPGYTYAASATLQTFTCMATQVFEGTAPSCEPITCSDLELGERFYHNCQSKRFGETCGVSCATGYHLQGWGEQMVCSADGTFSGTTPTCSGNPCSNPLLVDATLDSNECTGLTTAETCTVRCAAGFTPNSTTMQCDPTGLLLGVAPSCSPMVCDTPIELSAVSIAHTCSSLTFNRSCAVTCAAGYKLSSLQQEWACSWNASSASVSLLGSLPSCEPEVCTSGVPTESERTVTNCTDVRTGETCQQQCADGYIGSDGTFTCGSDGAARTDATVRCQPVTCNLSVPEARTASLGHICSNIPFGFSCSAFCQKGYTSTNGVQSLTCAGPELGIDPASELETADAITLRGSLPSCLPQACFYNFPTGSQFLHTCDGIRTGGQCTASCSSEWEGDSATLTCEPEGALSGNFPVCTLRTVTQTRTTSLTSTWTVTTTLTDFEVRVNVAGVLRMDVNNSVEFVQDPDAKGVVGQVLSNLIGVGIEELQLSMVLTTETLGRLLAVGGVTAVYSVWFLADTQQQADDLGSNITAQLDAASVFTLQQLIVDGMMNVSEAKVGFYSIQVLAHNADILVGTRRQEAVSKLVTGADGTICSPSSFPVITGAGPFDCQEPQVVGQQCRAPCDSGVEAVVTCDEQGWQLQDECPPESYLLVVIFASAGALCCLITVCVVLCACRGDAKTHPEEDRQETPDLPPPLPSIHELPQPENFDTSYYNWAEQWEQSRQSQGTDIPLVAPAGLPAATNAERSSAAIPTPPQRPPPVNMQRAVSSPPPLPSMARRDGSTDQQLVVQVEETEHVVLTRPHFLRKTAQMQDDAAIEELTTVEEPITLHVQRINGTPLAKITSDGKETVAELINSIKEVAGSSLNITLTTDIKVLRPEQTLQENGLYDGSVVTAIRHPELFVAAAFDDGTAAVWSVESGKCERNFECRYGAVKSCTLAQSGLVLVLGMVDGTVQLWNVVTGKFMRQFSGHMGPIFSVASSPNGKLLATGCFDGTSKLLNMETGRVVRVCSGHRGSIKSLCFSVDSRTLATGSEDCSLKLWKVLDRHGELTLLGHTSTVTAISFSHHGKALASGAENGEVNAWSAVSGRLVWELPQASSAVKSLAFSRDGVSLAVGSFDGEITFFSASTHTRTSRVQCSTTSPTRCMGFSPAAHLMIVGTEAGELRVYGSDDGASRKALEACAIPSMASSVASVAVCGGPVPKKPKGARRRSDLAIDSDSAAEAH